MLGISVEQVHQDLSPLMVSQVMSVLREDIAHKVQLQRCHVALVNLMLSCMQLVVQIVLHVGQVTIAPDLHRLDLSINAQKLTTVQLVQQPLLCNQLQVNMRPLSNQNL